MPAFEVPAGFPCPQTSTVQPEERRMLSEGDLGPRGERTIELDERQFQTFSWVLTADQAAIFRIWWRTTLHYGGAWFSAPATWPAPEGQLVKVRRFLGAPQWQYVGLGIWRLSLTAEVRGETLLPNEPVLSCDLAQYLDSESQNNPVLWDRFLLINETDALEDHTVDFGGPWSGTGLSLLDSAVVKPTGDASLAVYTTPEAEVSSGTTLYFGVVFGRFGLESHSGGEFYFTAYGPGRYFSLSVSDNSVFFIIDEEDSPGRSANIEFSSYCEWVKVEVTGNSGTGELVLSINEVVVATLELDGHLFGYTQQEIGIANSVANTMRIAELWLDHPLA